MTSALLTVSSRQSMETVAVAVARTSASSNTFMLRVNSKTRRTSSGSDGCRPLTTTRAWYPRQRSRVMVLLSRTSTPPRTSRSCETRRRPSLPLTSSSIWSEPSAASVAR